jgi:hypothetical protein
LKGFLFKADLDPAKEYGSVCPDDVNATFLLHGQLCSKKLVKQALGSWVESSVLAGDSELQISRAPKAITHELFKTSSSWPGQLCSKKLVQLDPRWLPCTIQHHLMVLPAVVQHIKQESHVQEHQGESEHAESDSQSMLQASKLENNSLNIRDKLLLCLYCSS